MVLVYPIQTKKNKTDHYPIYTYDKESTKMDFFFDIMRILLVFTFETVIIFIMCKSSNLVSIIS